MAMRKRPEIPLRPGQTLSEACDDTNQLFACSAFYFHFYVFKRPLNAATFYRAYRDRHVLKITVALLGQNTCMQHRWHSKISEPILIHRTL